VTHTAVVLLRKEPAYRREAFEAGLKALGYGIEMKYRNAPRSADDLLVLWNKKVGTDEMMANEWERKGGTVIIAENAYLQMVDKSAYAISTHGHNGSGWFPQGDEDRFSKLGFYLKPMRHDPAGYQLVCGQRGIGSKLMASPPMWGEKLFKKMQADKRHVKFREHPGNFKPKTSLLDDLQKAARCVIWSSSSGVRALVDGVPVTYHAPHWVCGVAYTKSVDTEEQRIEALRHMAHGQWSVEEIASGEPFARMRAHQWGPRKWAT
jgi:hypothetical protein